MSSLLEAVSLKQYVSLYNLHIIAWERIVSNAHFDWIYLEYIPNNIHPQSLDINKWYLKIVRLSTSLTKLD